MDGCLSVEPGGARRYPILALSELAPSIALGHIVDAKWFYPYESTLSMLWKLQWVNAMPAEVALRRYLPGASDLYDGLEHTAAGIAIKPIAKDLALSARRVQMGLGQAVGRMRVAPHLRTCGACCANRYHSIVHQCERLERCPIHRRRLRDVCTRCSKPIPFKLNIAMLEAQHRCPWCRAPFASTVRPVSRIVPMTGKNQFKIGRAFNFHAFR